MERPSDVQIQSFSMPFSSSVVKHTLLSLLRIFWAYSVLLTPSLKQRKSADEKITFILLRVILKPHSVNKGEGMSCKEFLQNAGKTYKGQYFFKDVLIMLQVFLKNYDWLVIQIKISAEVVGFPYQLIF